MKKKLLSALFIFSFLSIQSQNYEFTVSNETYQNLVDGISLNNGEIWDDPSFSIPLGFDFEIGDYSFNTIYIVDWSTGGTLSTQNATSQSHPIFSPLSNDIIDLGYWQGVTSQSNISYKVEGDEGDKILIIEWNNVGFYGDGYPGTSDFMNFQMWLYEEGNIIEYRYGPNQINNSSSSFDGEPGPSVNFFTAFNLSTIQPTDTGYILTDSPESPSLLVYNSGDPYPSAGYLNGSIPQNTVYTFSPESLGVAENTNISFSIYPNPSKNIFNVSLAQSGYIEYINVIDINGRIVLRNDYLGEQIVRLDLSQFSKGMYFLNINTTEGQQTVKIIKE